MINKLDIFVEEKIGNKGVHVTSNIKNDEELLYVPINLIITHNLARAKSSINQILLQNNLYLKSPKHTYLSIFLKEEIDKGKKSFWFPYINTLPENLLHIPIFYNKKELEWLKGSII